MFGVSRFSDLLAERRVRAWLVGATIASVVLALSAAYTVKPGDTLGEIAQQHGTSVSALARANGISNVDLIRTGQVLTIPGQDRTHRVASGESLSEIAGRYRVSVSELVRANDLANADLIRVGQVLTVPARGSGAGSSSSSSTTTHVVKAGETLGSIAARYGTSVSKLVELNGISNPSLIMTGATLTVSGTAGGTSGDASSSTNTTHTVKSGETLSEIAARYSTSVSAIVRLNGLKSADQIRVGQRLQIPAGGQGGGGASSGLRCPVPDSTFVNDYGYIKPDGRFHQGIDLFAPKGTNVYAPVSGRVEAVNGTIGGLQFWLHGDDGNLYIGTHLNGFGQVGQVQAGAVIGTVGDTGNAIGAPPHLHFEILVDGKTINPYQQLVAACR